MMSQYNRIPCGRDESGLMKNAGEGMSGIERLAIHIAESYESIVAALEGICEFCGRLA